MKLTAREWLLCLVGLIVTACVSVWGIDQHDARIRREAQFTDSAHRMAVRTAYLEARVNDARAPLRASAETVTVTRTAYAKARAPILLAPLTPADTVQDIKALPELVRTADAALAADSAHQANATKLQAESDSLIEALRDERDLWKHAKAPSLPRVTSSVAALYDPIGAVPVASAETAFRLTARIRVIARADQRFALGEHPHVGLGLALTF